MAPFTGSSRLCMEILQEVLGDYHPRDFTLRLWDGITWEAETAPARWHLVIHDPGAVGAMLRHPSMLSLGQAYTSGAVDVEGPMQPALALGEFLLGRTLSFTRKLGLIPKLLRLPPLRSDRKRGGRARLTGAPLSKERARQAISFHYDLPTEFFQLWLDDKMVYSGAYFHRVDQDLATAQTQKLDYICRKLYLERDMRLLDLGCGWGGLLLHAARQYGATTRGVTLSHQQAGHVGKLIRVNGLDGQCQVDLRDFRDLDDREAYDRIVSVGMIEHVAEPLHSEYYARAYRLLKPGGLFLSQGIAYSDTILPLPLKASFIDDYVFPDSELVPVSTTLKAAEQAGFEIRDVENLREHYALTLGLWLKGLEAHRDQVERLTDAQTYRRFRLYLAATAYGFERGRLQLFQVLLHKPTGGVSRLPLTRQDWYIGKEEPRQAEQTRVA